MTPRFLIFLAIFLLMALPLRAQTVIDQIAAQLREQGYTRIEVSNTLLGRARIEAKSRDWEREIIVNPRTGEILRDYWEARGKTAGGAMPGLLSSAANDGGKGRGRGGDDDGQGRGRGRGGDDGTDDKGDDGDSGDDGGNSGKGGGDGDGGDGD